MKRRILLFSVILVFGAACSKDQPAANLTFVAAANRMDHVDIRYISNVDLDKIFDASKEEKVVSRRLLCSLEGDQNFSVEHVIERYAEGEVLRTPHSNDSAIEYLSPVYFFETSDGDATRAYIKGNKLKAILGGREKIPCKVVMTVYLRRPYYSATMWMPSSDIMKVLPENFPVPMTR